MPTKPAPTTNTAPLDPTTTYAVRAAAFARYTKPGFPVGGVLEVTEQRSLSSKVFARRFAVQELPYTDGRRFKLSKPLAAPVKEGQEREYYVFLPPVGPLSCTCTAGIKSGKCSHAEAVLALARRGAFPAHPLMPGYVAPRPVALPRPGIPAEAAETAV